MMGSEFHKYGNLYTFALFNKTQLIPCFHFTNLSDTNNWARSYLIFHTHLLKTILTCPDIWIKYRTIYEHI